MHHHRTPRIYLAGELYFVTVKTFNNQPVFKDKIFAAIFCQTLKFLESRGDFVMPAGVLLPDHFHLLLKPEKKNISEIMHNLKSYTANQINNHRQGRDALSVEIDNHNPGRGRNASLSAMSNHHHHHHRPGLRAWPSTIDKINQPGLRAWPFIKIWQRGFYYHIITNDFDLQNHFNYIIYNPVKHGYAAQSEDWPYLWFDREKLDCH